MHVPSGLEIAHRFVDNHAHRWVDAQGCDGLDLERDGLDYCYIWIEMFADHDLLQFFLIDVRTKIDGQPESRDYLYVRYGNINGKGLLPGHERPVEVEWFNNPMSMGSANIVVSKEESWAFQARCHKGMIWFCNKIAGALDEDDEWSNPSRDKPKR